MDKKMTTIVAVILVVIIVAAAAVVIGGSGSKNSSSATIDSQLQIRGNANGDYTIDSKDMEIVDDIIAGKKTLADYPLADVNNDNEVNETDKKLLQDLIDRKEGCTVYVLCLDTAGAQTTVECKYPLRNLVAHGSNIFEPALYAGGGEYFAGYFVNTYKNAAQSLNADAVDLGGSSRSISDAAWKNFTELDAKVGIGALIVDSSATKQITTARQADLSAAGIPLIVYASADAEEEVTTALTLSFLFGKEKEEIGVKYAELSWDVINQVKEKTKNLADSDKCTYINFTMRIYICQNDSTFNTTAATAGGRPYYEVNEEFKNTYAGTSSTKMASVEALSNYKDAGAFINNRSIDWISADEMKATIIDCWEYDNSPGMTKDYFVGVEDKLVFVNNLLPGAVKVAYMAQAMYGDMFSEEWADGVMQDFIDLDLDPLEGQSLDTIPAYITYDDYNAAKA